MSSTLHIQHLLPALRPYHQGEAVTEYAVTDGENVVAYCITEAEARDVLRDIENELFTKHLRTVEGLDA